MLFLLSPAKTLDYASHVPDVPHTLPVFAADAARLIAVLRRYSPQQLARLMEISDPLAALNVARYQAWTPKFTGRNSRQAVLAFDGDVLGPARSQHGLDHGVGAVSGFGLLHDPPAQVGGDLLPVARRAHGAVLRRNTIRSGCEAAGSKR